MATVQESQQIDIEAVNETSCQHQKAEVEISHPSSLLNCPEENSHLFKHTWIFGKKVISRFKSRRCCPWSSKAALIILVWNLE